MSLLVKLEYFIWVLGVNLARFLVSDLIRLGFPHRGIALYIKIIFKRL